MAHDPRARGARAGLREALAGARGRLGSHHGRRLLLAWAAAPALEALLVAADPARPTVGQWAFEVSAWILAGCAHAALAPEEDWRGSAMWPGLLLVGCVVFRVHGESVPLSPWAPVLLLALTALVLVRLLDRPLRKRVPALALTALAALGARAAAVGPPTVPPVLLDIASADAGGEGGPPVVVVTVDTLRSDAAGSMTTLRWLTARGSVFPRAMAGASWTVPSLATLWTGEPTAIHGAGRRADGSFTAIRPGVATLAEELSEEGYRTAAIVTNPFVGEVDAGLRRGFRRWTWVDHATTQPLAGAGWPPRGNTTGDARVVIDAALRWLEDAPPRSFLLWVHLFEPHLPYEHAPNPERFHGELFDSLRAGEPWSLSRDELSRAYEREVAYVDGQIMRLLGGLAARGHFEEGVLVFASDHGEEMLEHGSGGHGHSHHGEVLDVPLAVVAPGARTRARHELASLEDVAPTVRAAVGLEPRGLDLRGPIAADRAATADGNLYYGRERSLRVGTLRVIERDRRDARDLRVYDLSADPGELRSRPPTDAEGERFRTAWRAVAPSGGDAPRFEVDDARLRALGYLP